MKPNEMEVGWVVVANIGECFVRGRVMEKTEEGGLIVKDEWATDVEIRNDDDVFRCQAVPGNQVILDNPLLANTIDYPDFFEVSMDIGTVLEIIKMNEQLVFFGKEEHYYVCSRARMDEATMYEEV